MPEIPVGAQIFDLAFHPAEPVVFTGLLTGEVKAFGYDEQGNHQHKFTIRPSKRSCRSVVLNVEGSQIWTAGKGKAIHTIDVTTEKVVDSRLAAHSAAINRMKRAMPHLLASGDDDGVVKLWDPRKPDAVQEYTHHFDFISDFMWLEDKKQLVATSGDGTLSVMDVRSKKTEPFAQSEDQEDELLSILAIKGGQKAVVGTQLGILSVFNRKSGWGDCVDRIPGHPQSIDALCAIPSHYPNAQSTILTGSSDGLLRAVQILPTKLLGVIADHGEFPIERIAVDMGGEGRWVGSAGHEEVLKLTDLKEVFEDDGEEDEEVDAEEEADDVGAEAEAEDDDVEEDGTNTGRTSGREVENMDEAEDADGAAPDVDSSSEEEVPEETAKKRKRKKDKDGMHAVKRKKGKNEIDAEGSFFADL